MILQADWTNAGTKQKLESEIGNGFKVRLGWTETESDTLLCVEQPMYAVNPSDGFPDITYRVFIWNRVGVRAQLAELLGMPVFNRGRSNAR